MIRKRLNEQVNNRKISNLFSERLYDISTLEQRYSNVYREKVGESKPPDPVFFFPYFLSTDLKYDCHKDDTLNRYVRHIRVKVAGLKEFVHT
jgi:hypothetical protein